LENDDRLSITGENIMSRSSLKLSGALLLASAIASASLSTACSDDDVHPPSSNGGSSGEAGSIGDGGGKAGGAGKPSTDAGSDAGGAPGSADAGEGGTAGEPGAEESVYALTTQVFGETETQSYVLLTRTLDSKTSLSLDHAVVEIAGRALGTGPEGSGALFVAGELGPTITRYDLNAGGDDLSGGNSVSFLGKGITSFGEYGGQFQYASAKKAYWFDGPTAQIVVWNPTTMKVTGSVALTSLAHAEETLSFTAAPIWKGDKLYTFAAWRKGLAITPRLAVVVLDTSKDSATIVEDTRCGYVRDGVLENDGQLYVATEAFGSAAHYLNAANPPPCLLRFDTAKNEFDAAFKVELSSLFSGDSAGTLVVGPGNQAFLRVLDKTAIPEGVTNPRVLGSAAAWAWAKVTPGDQPEVELLSDAPLGGGSVLPFALGNRTFAPVFVAGEETQFLELTADGPSSDGAIIVPGLVFSAVKLK
jgi:hypothetical protein